MKTVVGNMRMFGMTQEVEGSSGLVKKDTKLMTNAITRAERPNKTCDKCNKTHKHIQLVGGRADKGQIHPEELRAQMLRID